MNELLVKYIDIEDLSGKYISAITYRGDVSSLLPVLEQCDSILLEDGWYGFVCSEFRPATRKGELDALYVYVEDYYR